MAFLPKVSSSPSGGSLVAILEGKDILEITLNCKNLASKLCLNYHELNLNVDPIKFLKCLQSNRLPQLVIVKNNTVTPPDYINEWFKALGSTQQPSLILATSTNISTFIAYKSLLEKYHVPFLGIVKLGGAWDPIQYKSNELVWCGWWQGLEASLISRDVSDLETFSLIRQRWAQIINDNLLENQK